MSRVRIRPPKCRRWCFTENDPLTVETLTTNLEIEGLPNGIRYIIYQHERGDHDHLQGYIELSRDQQMTWLRKNFSMTAHFEPAKGTRDQNRAYCTKEDTRVNGPWEFGSYERGGQGSRTDLHDIADKIKNKVSLNTIINEHPVSYIRYHRGIEQLSMKLNPQVTTSLCTPEDFTIGMIDAESLQNKVYIIHGTTGLGKTQYALTHFKSALFVTHIDILFSFNPEIHDGIVFDDISFRHYPIDTRKHITDMYQSSDIHIRYRTAHIPAYTPRIFTCNKEDIFFNDFPDEEEEIHKDAIRRRIEIIEVKERILIPTDEEMKERAKQRRLIK